MKAVDRSRVIAEVYPGAANAIEAHVRARGGWRCELHPDRPFPHDDCPGPGMPAQSLGELTNPEDMATEGEW